MNEHKTDITKGKQSTALAKHILETGHTADFVEVRILDKEKTEKKRYIEESLRIQQNIKNLKEDTDNINNSYVVAITKSVI